MNKSPFLKNSQGGKNYDSFSLILCPLGQAAYVLVLT